MNIRKSYQQTVGYIGVITKDYAKLSSRKCVKKCNNYSTKLPSDKNLKEMRQTLNNILPKENKRASGGDSSNLSATKFNEFFCINRMEFMQCLKRPSLFSILVPRVNKEFYCWRQFWKLWAVKIRTIESYWARQNPCKTAPRRSGSVIAKAVYSLSYKPHDLDRWNSVTVEGR